MKVLLSVLAGFFMVQASAFANLQCTTGEGIQFSIIEDSNRNLECDVHFIVIGGKKIATEAASDDCSYLSSFTGTDGSKISLSANGVGNYVYANGKVVAVNCNRAK
jgi:hypothetical protein